jgi:hypothetical protein
MESGYKEHPFTVTGTVYATTESHAQHFVYWAMEEALNHSDESHASVRFSTRTLDSLAGGAIPAPKPASAHIALQH